MKIVSLHMRSISLNSVVNDCNRSLTMEDRQMSYTQLTLTVNERLAKHLQIKALEAKQKTVDANLSIQSLNSWLLEL